MWLILKRSFANASTSAISVKPPSSLEFLERKGPGGRSSVTGKIATVFGCTGFLGRYVVNRLARSGTQVVLPYRGEPYDYQHLKLMGDLGQIVPMKFHLKDYESIHRAVKHSDVVINLIGRSHETRNFNFKEVHVDGAQTIARAARNAKVPRLIHVSALGAQFHSRSRFFQSKALGEDAIRHEFPSATILRPSTLFGHEDDFFNRMAWLRLMPLGIPVVNYGQQKVQPVYVVDVAAAIARAVQDVDAVHRTYELVGPKQYTYFELLEYFSRITHKKLRTINLPRPIYEFIGSLFDLMPRSKICKEDVIRMQLDERKTSGVAGFSELGISPTKIESVALQYLRRFRSGTYYDEPISDDDYYTVENSSTGNKS